MTLPRLRRDVIAHRPGTIIGVLDVTLGLVLIFGGPARTSAFSFAVAREVAPMRWWGAAFLLVGLAVFWSLRIGRAGVAAAIVGAALHTFWVTTLGYAALLDDRAALTGLPAYGCFAALHLITALRLTGMAPTPRR